jgi:hypothetical protein
MQHIGTAASLLGAGLLSAAVPSSVRAEAPAGLPVGACVVTLYGSPGVITGTIEGGYTIRSQHGGYALRHHYAGLNSVPCPSVAAEPKASTATPAPATPGRAGPPVQAAARNPAGRGGATMGSYHCVLFIPGSGLVTQSGFTLLPGGRYTHQLGGGGSTRVSGDLIEFTGGPLAGQAGKVSPGRVNLYNPGRTRTVIDCDTNG